jgi:integrase
MPRNNPSRQANLRSTIYQGEDGYWHGRVTMGVRDYGTPDRRHVMSRDKAKVTAKVRRLDRQAWPGLDR